MTTATSAEDDLHRAPEPPLRRIGVAVEAADGDEYLFCALDAEDAESAWSGVVRGATADAALLEVFLRIRGDVNAADRIRFVVKLPHGSPLWVNVELVRAVLPGCTVQGPGPHDAGLITATAAGLPAEPPAPTAESLALPPLTVATDGSVRGRFCGYAWLAHDSQHGLHGRIDTRRVIGRRASMVTELRAIDDAVRALTHRRLTIYCDNSYAVSMGRKWMNGHEILPDGYTTERAHGKPAGLVVAQRRLRRNRERLDIRWAPSHRGEPLNEGADALARLASRYIRGDSGLSVEGYRERAGGLAAAFGAAFRKVHAIEP